MTKAGEWKGMRELSLHILDVLENALEAGATQVTLSIVEDLEADRLAIVVEDNGRGMDAQTAGRALDPFFTTRATRHVGLGLPLFAAAAQRCDGELKLTSAPGQGTKVTATFRHSHLDRAPLGNMTDTLLAFLLGNPGGLELRYRHRVGDRTFELDTAAIRAELGEIPFSHPAVRQWLHDYIAEGEAELTLRNDKERRRNSLFAVRHSEESSCLD
jgi:anti-sigma regulatory factor (Ser/Thr protein kinase)